MTDSSDSKFRRIDDIDPDWLARYAENTPGVFLFGDIARIEELRLCLAPQEWIRLHTAWHRHRNAQNPDSSPWSEAVGSFEGICMSRGLDPARALHDLATQLSNHAPGSGDIRRIDQGGRRSAAAGNTVPCLRLRTK